MYKRGLMSFFLILFIVNSSWAVEKAKIAPLKREECMITTDFYIVHLTSYQEPDADSGKKRNRFEPFCQTLPGIGRSYLAVDFLDRDLRQMAIKMHVVEKLDNPEGEGLIDGKIIAESTAANHKNGVAQIQVDFPTKGHYELVLTVGDDMFADKINIPLRVGIGEPFDWGFIIPILFFILLAVVAYFIYRFFLFRHQRRMERSQD